MAILKISFFVNLLRATDQYLTLKQRMSSHGVNYYIMFNLEKNGYAKVDPVKVDSDSNYSSDLNLLAYYDSWCKEHYPDDYIIVNGCFWFTSNKEAIHFKLACL